MKDDDKRLLLMDSAAWTRLPEWIEKEDAPFYIFHEEKVIENIQALRRRLRGVRLTYAMKSNPWLAPAACSAADRIEICSPGELAQCRDYGIPGGKLIADSPLASFWEDALRMGCRCFSVDSPWHLKQLLLIAGQTPLKLFLRVTSGNQFGMDLAGVRKCLDLAAHGAAQIRGIQFFPGTQRQDPRRVRRELACLRKWIADCEGIPGFRLKEIEFGAGIGVPYFEGEDPESYVELLDIVEEFILDMQGRYQITYEAGRLVTASCGVYVTEISAKKQRGDTGFLFCKGGTNHLRYPGGFLGVRTPLMRALCVLPSGIPGKHMICGPLCSESDVLVRECQTLDNGLSVGDKIIFFGAGAYTATESPNLFLSMEIPRVLMYNKGHGLRPACGYALPAEHSNER